MAKQTKEQKSPNDDLGLEKFNYRKLDGDDYAEYVKIVQSLDQRTPYDWTEYKAIGKWKQIEDQNGDMQDSNILVGISLVDATALKNTSVEARHIEFYMTNQRGRKVMGGLNAQIYDKNNPRTNSRFYLLKQADKEVKA